MSFDLNKVVLWNNFKMKVLAALDEAPPFEVDLAFEYKNSMGTVVTFTSGDVFCISDLKFSGNSELCFEIPFGAESRFVRLDYADSISNEELGPLDVFIDKMYAETVDDMTDAKGLPDNILAFADSIAPSEINSFNNSADWIKQTIEKDKDKKSFETMDKFGMF
jgi:hypothetical protein